MNVQCLRPLHAVIAILVMAVVARAEPKSTSASPTNSPSQPLSLRGDTSFTRDRQPADVRVWYDRLWKAISHPTPGATNVGEGEILSANNAKVLASCNNS